MPKLAAAAVSWEDLKAYVYFADGSLRDLYVLDTTREDWAAWADFVNARYPVRFSNADYPATSRIDMAEVLRAWSSHGQESYPTATVTLGLVGLNCHFFGEDEIENDIDPRQVNTPADHEALLAFMQDLAQHLGKEVVLTGENDKLGQPDVEPLISVGNDEAVVHAYWLR